MIAIAARRALVVAAQELTRVSAPGPDHFQAVLTAISDVYSSYTGDKCVCELVFDWRTAGTTDAEPENVQWWLASVDQYGNATLVDGAHGDMAGVNKAAFLFDRMGLTNGRKLAAAKVELYEPKPSADGVNMDAVRECNRARLAAAPSPQSPAGGEGQA